MKIPLDYLSKNGLLVHKVSARLISLTTARLPFRAAEYIYTPSSRAWEFPIHYTFPNTKCYTVFLFLPIRCISWLFQFVLNGFLVSFMISSNTMWAFPLRELSFHMYVFFVFVSGLCFYWSSCFLFCFVVNTQELLYILDTDFLSDLDCKCLLLVHHLLTLTVMSSV